MAYFLVDKMVASTMSHESFCYCCLYSNSAILLKQTLPFFIILHISLNTPCLPPNILHKRCLQFLLRRNEKQNLCKIWVGGGQTRCIMVDMQMENRADTFLSHIWFADLRAKYFTSSLSASCLSTVRNPS